MNRFLYAQGNPTSLIDPTGYAAQGQVCPYGPEDCAGWRPDTSTGGADVHPTTGSVRPVSDGVKACLARTPLASASACFDPAYGAGPPGSYDQVLAFYQGVCDTTLCGLVELATHPDEALKGLVVAAANGTAPGLVELLAPDLSLRAQATAFADRLRSPDADASARAQGQLFGMVAALLLPLRGLRGARTVPPRLYLNGSGTANNLTPRLTDVDVLSAFDTIQRGIVKGGKGQCIATECLAPGGLTAVRTGPEGHYSIRPIDPAGMADWLESRRSGAFETSPYTRFLQEIAETVWNR